MKNNLCLLSYSVKDLWVIYCFMQKSSGHFLQQFVHILGNFGKFYEPYVEIIKIF